MTVAVAMAACIPGDDPALTSAAARATAQAQATPTAPGPTLTPSPLPAPTLTVVPAPTLGPTPTEAPAPTPTPASTPTPSPTPTLPPTVDPKLAELDAVSAAVATLMADNGLSVIPNPVTASEPPCTTGTTAMTRFPDTASAAGTVDKPADPGGRVYDLGDKDGYVLFGHDILADLLPSTVVSYVRFVRSVWCYTVEPDGYVRQYDESGAETPRPPRPTPTTTPTATPTLTPTPTISPAAAQKLQRAELLEISAAVALLMRQANLVSIPNPVIANTAPCTVGTQDMTSFPDATSGVGTNNKLLDPFGTPYTDGADPLGDKDGYLLIEHDILADGQQILLQPYVGLRETMWCYTVDSNGTVYQYDDAGALLGFFRAAPLE